MEVLLSKEHYCYKIHTVLMKILMKTSAYLLFYRQPLPPDMGYTPHFYKKILILPFCDFSKTPPINKVRSSHYEMDVIRVVPSFS